MHNVYQQPELCYYGPASSLSICCALCATTLALTHWLGRRGAYCTPNTKRPPLYTHSRRARAHKMQQTTELEPLGLLLRIRGESDKVSSASILDNWNTFQTDPLSSGRCRSPTACTIWLHFLFGTELTRGNEILGLHTLFASKTLLDVLKNMHFRRQRFCL